MHASHAPTCKSVMIGQSALGLILRKEDLQINGMMFNGIMLQSEIEHTDDFYGNALISANLLAYNKHHDPRTGKPLNDVVYGNFWFTRNDKTGKLAFGGCPEDPVGNNVVFADIRGDIADEMMGDKETFSFRDLQHQTAAAVREYAGSRIPEADWDAWIDRMYVKPAIGSFMKPAESIVPFSEPGKVLRVLVTFENAKALEAARGKILDKIWNKEFMSPSNLIKKTDAAMQEISNVEGWRSVVQLSNQMKCYAHFKKCLEEWMSIKNAKFSYTSSATLNILVLTLTCTVPIRSEVYDIFKEEAKKPVEKPTATDPFVVRMNANSYFRNHKRGGFLVARRNKK